MTANGYFFSVAALCLLLLSACNGDSSSSGSEVDPRSEINLVGVWQYTQWIEKSSCELSVKGTSTVDASSDGTTIDTFKVQGQFIGIDKNRECFAMDVNYETDSWQGRPSTQTASQYLSYFKEDYREDVTVKTIRLDRFNNSETLVVVVFVTGAERHTLFER